MKRLLNVPVMLISSGGEFSLIIIGITALKSPQQAPCRNLTTKNNSKLVMRLMRDKTMATPLKIKIRCLHNP